MVAQGALPTIGRYELVAPIAAGGMGSVVLARLAAAGGFQRLFALKFLHREYARDSEFVAGFLDEARIAARIHHPNVVSIQEIGESDTQGTFLVMDYVEGFSAAECIPLLRSLAPRQRHRIVSRIVIDALNGLDAAHTLLDDDGRPMHVVHRDVSPQNILVGVDGIARVTDFGIAQAAARLVHTTRGEVKGKFGYMSPEQASAKPVDARSDVFAMGIVLWELLAQKRLFYGTPVEVIAAIAQGRVPDVRTVAPETPATVVAVLAGALQRDPDARYRTARDFAAALDAALRFDEQVGSAHDVGTFIRDGFTRQLAERRSAVRKVAHDTIVESGPKAFDLASIDAAVKGSSAGRANPRVPSLRPSAPQVIAMSAPVPAMQPPISDIADDDYEDRVATESFDANQAPPEVRALIEQHHARMSAPPVAPMAPRPAPPASPLAASSAPPMAPMPPMAAPRPPARFDGRPSYPSHPSYPSYPSPPLDPRASQPDAARTAAPTPAARTRMPLVAVAVSLLMGLAYGAWWFVYRLH